MRQISTAWNDAEASRLRALIILSSIGKELQAAFEVHVRLQKLSVACEVKKCSSVLTLLNGAVSGEQGL